MDLSRLLLTLCALTICCCLAGCQKEKEKDRPPAVAAAGPAPEGTVVAVGDSLTAGLGLPEGDAYPAQLERRLNRDGYRWRVVNAGISGETSSGTLSRVNWILKLNPEVVILETGANDGLRGVDPRLTRANIEGIVAALQAKGVVVVLAGMRMQKNLGEDYVARFSAIYPQVARERRTILIPFFLDKVAGDPGLNQADGIHPTAPGYAIVTETVYPYLLQGIEQKKGSKPR